MRGNTHVNLLVTARSTKIMGEAATVLFLLLHIAMAAIFHRFEVTPMVNYSVVSVFAYIPLMVLLYREYWRIYAFCMFAQVYAYMSLAVLNVGWDSGFQLSILAMIVLGFYAEYAARSMGVPTLHAVFFAFVGLVLYIVLLVTTSQGPAPYSFPDEVELGLRILWGVAVFVIVTAYLELFIIIAYNSVEEQSDKATHDKLTLLPNRYYMSDYLNGLATSEGLDGHWVAMADIDDFKRINDTYGHNCGDYVLRSIADILKSNEGDYAICRWGGEEFLLAGRCDDHGLQPYESLERLRKMVEEHGFWQGEDRLNLTITIGAACYHEGQSLGEWVNAADKKLYEGKCSGKNKVVV